MEFCFVQLLLISYEKKVTVYTVLIRNYSFESLVSENNRPTAEYVRHKGLICIL